jgi:hypothetical protein
MRVRDAERVYWALTLIGVALAFSVARIGRPERISVLRLRPVVVTRP